MTTTCTNSEERDTKERNFIPKVAHDTNHPVGVLAPDVKGGAPTQIKRVRNPFQRDLIARIGRSGYLLGDIQRRSQDVFRKRGLEK